MSMGTNMPQNRRDAQDFLNAHAAGWLANATAIGLTADQVTDLIALLNEANIDLTNAETARDTSKSATLGWYTSNDAARGHGASMISAIKAFADAAESPNAVYELANLSPKDPPEPVAAPVPPEAFNMFIKSNGNVEITWKISNPPGTLYILERQLEGETGWTRLTTSSKKAYEDKSVPAGTPLARYRVTPVRSDVEGDTSATQTILFGVAQAQQSVRLSA